MAQAKQEMVIACDLSVFTPEQLEAHRVVCDRLFGAVREARDLPNGYAFRLPEDSAILVTLADFISAERRCCAFETFEIRVEPWGDSIWFHLLEPEGVKAALAPELIKRLDPSVAAGLS